MSSFQAAVTILIIALATLLLRAAPFVLFPKAQKAPPFIRYLGRVLPHAVMGMLVVYCFKAVNFTRPPYGLPEILAALAAMGLHLWKRSVILSIASSTVLYMVLLKVMVW
jgi:branched-subunit amino acid transport protein AzlD